MNSGTHIKDNLANDKRIDESQIEIMHTNRHFNEEDIKQAAVIHLEDESGDLLGKNHKLKINAAGLVNGLRKVRDGVAIFGTSKQNKNNEITVDFELNLDLPSQYTTQPYLFLIYFKKRH